METSNDYALTYRILMLKTFLTTLTIETTVTAKPNLKPVTAQLHHMVEDEPDDEYTNGNNADEN